MALKTWISFGIFDKGLEDSVDNSLIFGPESERLLLSEEHFGFVGQNLHIFPHGSVCQIQVQCPTMMQSVSCSLLKLNPRKHCAKSAWHAGICCNELSRIFSNGREFSNFNPSALLSWCSQGTSSSSSSWALCLDFAGLSSFFCKSFSLRIRRVTRAVDGAEQEGRIPGQSSEQYQMCVYCRFSQLLPSAGTLNKSECKIKLQFDWKDYLDVLYILILSGKKSDTSPKDTWQPGTDFLFCFCIWGVGLYACMCTQSKASLWSCTDMHTATGTQGLFSSSRRSALQIVAPVLSERKVGTGRDHPIGWNQPGWNSRWNIIWWYSSSL